MTKEQMHALAAFGVRSKLANMERELRDLFRSFPEQFAGTHPPALLKPELKPRGNSWPPFTANVNGNGSASAHADEDRRRKGSAGHRASWTPARRKRQAVIMRKRSLAMHRARRANEGKWAAQRVKQNGKRPASGKAAWGRYIWQKAHDFLATQPKQRATLQDLLKATDVKLGASLITSIDGHKDVFKRIKPGVYGLKKVVHGKEANPS